MIGFDLEQLLLAVKLHWIDLTPYQMKCYTSSKEASVKVYRYSYRSPADDAIKTVTSWQQVRHQNMQRATFVTHNENTEVKPAINN